MPAIKIPMDSEMYEVLIEEAARHLRPADWHAQALLRKALGLAFPYPDLGKRAVLNPAECAPREEAVGA